MINIDYSSYCSLIVKLYHLAMALLEDKYGDDASIRVYTVFIRKI
jgi:hypothetical protein